MQIIHLDLKNPPALPPLALTIGNFDGIHLGHQAMLTALHRDAQNKGLHTAVMIFEPQPREFFNPDNPPARLTNLSEKSALMATFDLDFLLVARFDDEFRSLSAQAFGDLLYQLHAKHLVLGDDFRFGHDRRGDKAFLESLGFSVDNLPTISHDQQRISSTAVRNALMAGDLSLTKMLLGRDYHITGEVVHGDKIGRTLDFPTANIHLDRLKPALHGVFGAEILIYQNNELLNFTNNGIYGTRPHSLFGAVNIGTRPSVNGMDYRLEVHLPNFTGDLYGLTLQVIFLTYLHGEKKYPTLYDLKLGIQKDIDELLLWRQSVK